MKYLAAFLLAASLCCQAHAEALTVKLATLAPQGSTWERALRELGSRWEKRSNGSVKLRIYAGGVAGAEGVMVRKMRIGQLQAASLTNIGLHDIDEAPQVIQTPMLVRSNEELDYVMRHIAPELEQRIAQKGFVVLNWSDIGWVRMFSAKPLLEPVDAAKYKTWVWGGDPDAARLFRSAGFRPVILDSTDVLPGLQSGLIDAFPSAPLSALGMQWFALAPNMLDVPWAPLMGATIISLDTWKLIPEEYREDFRADALSIGAGIQKDVRDQERKAIAVMQQYGLEINTPDAAQRARWEALESVLTPVVSNGIVPPEILDRVTTLLADFRSGNGGGE